MQFILTGCSQYQKSFFPLFSIIFSRSLFIVYSFVSSENSLFSTAHFTANTFKILLNRLTYSYPSSFLDPDTISLCPQHNLHLSHSTDPLSFSMFLFLSFTSVMRILTVFSCGTFQPARVFFTILLWYFTLNILFCQTLLFIPFLSFIQDLFQFFPPFSPFSITFFVNNYNSFIKTYRHVYLFSWYLFFPAFISPCYSYSFLCGCSHVACHSSFFFFINLFETFQSSATFVCLWIKCLMAWFSSMKSFSPQCTFHYTYSSSKSSFPRFHTSIM